MTAAASAIDVQYGIANIKTYEAIYNEKGGVDRLVIDNRIEAKPSDRFWSSLWCQFSNFGLSPKLSKLFSYRELFDRLHERLPEHGGELRYAIETGPTGNTLLGLSRPTKAICNYAPTFGLIERSALEADKVTYHNGIIRATHAPALMADFDVNGDEFAHRYVTETPIDGFGLPSMYLAMYRLVCSNGAVAMTPAFRSSVQLGKDETDPVATLGRAIDSFNAEEGYAALRQRFELAARSWASIRECQRTWKVLKKLIESGGFSETGKQDPVNPDHHWTRESTFVGRKGQLDELSTRRSVARRLSEDCDMGQKVERAYLQLSGDIIDLYKLTDIDALSDKKQGQMPSKCSVYELLNLCTELATHYTTGALPASKIDALVGGLVAGEYDLEKSKDTKPQYSDWFMDVTAPGLN